MTHTKGFLNVVTSGNEECSKCNIFMIVINDNISYAFIFLLEKE